MKTISKVVGLLVILTILFSFSPVKFGNAAPDAAPNGSCDQVEIVFIMDQSGSMGGKEAGSLEHPVPNDPQKVRFFGLLYAMRWATNQFLLSQNVPGQKPPTFSMSVVNFGDVAEKLDFSDQTTQPSVVQHWQSLNPTNYQDMLDMQKDLEKKLVPDKFKTKNLGSTNFLNAFIATHELFREREQVEDGCPRRAIFLLTDGEPSGPGGDFGELKKYVNENFPENQGYSVYVTAINDPNSPGTWQLYKDLWESLSGRASDEAVAYTELVFSSDQIATRFENILDHLSGKPPVLPVCGDYVVAPYLQEIDIVLNKLDPTGHLRVSDDLGELSPTRTDVDVKIIGENEIIEIMRILLPRPGNYKLETTPGTICKVYPYPIRAAANITSPLGAVAWQFSPVKVEFQLVDSQKKPLPLYDDPRYQIHLQASIGNGDRSWPVTMQSGPDNTYFAEFIPVEAGKHTLSVKGETQDINGSAIVVIGGSVGDFLVGPVQLKQIGDPQVSTPAQGCPLQVGDTVTYTYQAQTTDGTPIAMALPVEWDVVLGGPTVEKPLVSPLDANSLEYKLPVKLIAPGNYALKAVATLKETDGTLRQLLNTNNALQVAETKPIQIMVNLQSPTKMPWWYSMVSALNLLPASGKTIGNDPFFQSLPLEAEILFSEDGFTPIDPAKIFQNPPSDVLTVNYTGADELNPIPVHLVATVNAGRYQTSITGLELGKYVLHIQLKENVGATCGYTLENPKPIEIERVMNPLNYIEFLIIGLLLIAIIVRLLYLWCRGNNPCPEGSYIGILNEKGNLVDGWYKELTGRNNWHLKDGIPEKTNIQEIRIRSTGKNCGRDPYPNGRLEITVIQIIETNSIPPIFIELGKDYEPPQLPGYKIRYARDDRELRRKNSN